MANILLISYFFPPHNSSPCRRVYGWAKYLHKQGHAVIVLTAETPGDRTVKSFEADISFLTVYRLCYPDPLVPFARLFATQELLKDTPGRRANVRMVFFRKALNFINAFFSKRGVLFGCTRFPTFFEAWFPAAYAKAKEIIGKHDIQVVITSSPPPTVNIVGLRLKMRYRNLLWVADHRDLWTQNPVHRGLFPFTAFEQYYERRCIRNSDVLITVSGILKKALAEKYPEKAGDIFCIENGFDEDLTSSFSRKISEHSSKKKTVIYAGTLYEGRRDPDLLFRVAEEESVSLEKALEIVFYGNYETRRILDKLFARYPVAGKIIRYGGFRPAQEILELEQQAQALLFLENDRYDDGVYTAKVFEYMKSAKPILCVGIAPDSGVGSLLAKSGLCIFCGNDIIKVREALLAIAQQKIAVHPDADYIGQFSREKQVVRLSSIIGKYLNRQEAHGHQ